MDLTDAEVIEWIEQHCYAIHTTKEQDVVLSLSPAKGVGLGFNLRSIVAALKEKGTV